MTTKWLSFLSGMALALGFATTTQAGLGDTLAQVKERGSLLCTSHNGSYSGFAELDDKGKWRGFDIDLCRGLAVAIFGTDEGHLDLVPLSWAQRFPSIQAGDVDIIIKATGWTMGRDTEVGLQFSMPYFLGTNNVMAHKATGAKTVVDLSGGTVCIPAGTTLEQQWSAYAERVGVKVEVVTFEKSEELLEAYYSNRCDAYAQGGPELAIARSEAKNPDAHVILPDVLGMEPLAAATRQGDDKWVDLANWLFFTLIFAEEEGITSANVDKMKANPPTAKIGKVLGVTPGYGKRLGLSDDWGYNVIKAIGNYGEIFHRNLGNKSPYDLPRGLNALWSDGGVLYHPLID